MRFQEHYLQIAHQRYHFLKFILEGYDGLCLLSTVPGKRGQVCLRYPEASRETLMDLLAAIDPSISPTIPR